MKFFSLSLIVSATVLSSVLTLNPAQADELITNEIKLSSLLSTPSTPSLRGQTTFQIAAPSAYISCANGGSSMGLVAFSIIGAPPGWETDRYNTYNYTFNGATGAFTLGEITIGGVKIGVTSSQYSNLPKKILGFDTSGWPAGSYRVTGYLSDCTGWSTATLTFALPEIPKPILSCIGPNSVFQNTKFAISCTSSFSLSTTGISVFDVKSQKPGALSTFIVEGSKFDLPNISIENLGLNQLQVVIPEQRDQIQLSRSNVIFVQVDAPRILPTLSLIATKSAESQPVIIEITGDQTGLPVSIQTSDSPNGPWKDNLMAIAGGSSNTLNLKTGTWVMANFVGDSRYQAAVSDPVQVLITPIVKCSFPASAKSNVEFTVTCSSNIALPSTPVSLDFQNDGAWKSLTNAFIKGTVSKLKFTLSGNGKAILRISSSGVANKFSAFISSKGVTNILAPASSSGSSSNSNSAPPKGKVDKTSNAYKTMYNVGKNFAKVSFASDTAMVQCTSARLRGIINAQGHPQYLGQQAQMLQSYLNTASGFQGCLDGFGH